MFGIEKFANALMLPDTREQNGQQQVIYCYDPRKFYQQEQEEEEEEQCIDVEWDTFVLYGRSDSVLWRIKYGQQYIDELEEVYRQMMSELRTVRVMGGVNNLITRYNELLDQFTNASKELAVLKAEKEYQEEQTKKALEMSNKTEKINRVLEENGYERSSKEEQPKENNRYASKDGRRKPEKQRIAVAMRGYGYSDDAIAATCGIGVASVGTYIAEMKGKYEFWKNDDGDLCVTFNDKLGLESMKVCDMLGIPRVSTTDTRECRQIKEDEESIPKKHHSSAGVIVKQLKTPVISG